MVVYSPFYLLAASTAWKLAGVTGVRLLSWLGAALAAFALMALLRRINAATSTVVTGLAAFLAILATPMLFYMSAIWEHALFAGIALWALHFRLGRGSAENAVAGLLAAAACSLRPEGALWAVALLFAGRKEIPAFLEGIAVGAVPVLLLEAHWTGSPLSLQWTSNFGGPGVSLTCALISLRTTIGLVNMTFGLVVAAGALISLWLSLRGSGLSKKWGVIGMMMLWGWIALTWWLRPVHLTGLAAASGLVATAPLAVATWMLPYPSPAARRVALTMALFVLLATVANPVPLGIHWGPRFLLPALVLLTSMALVCLPSLDRWRQTALLILLATSLVINAKGMQILAQQRADNAAMRHAVDTLVGDDPVVVGSWYFGGDLGPTALRHRFLYPNSVDEWDLAMQVLSTHESAGFWWLGPPDRSAPWESLNPGVWQSGRSVEGKHWRLVQYRWSRPVLGGN